LVLLVAVGLGCIITVVSFIEVIKPQNPRKGNNKIKK